MCGPSFLSFLSSASQFDSRSSIIELEKGELKIVKLSDKDRLTSLFNPERESKIILVSNFIFQGLQELKNSDSLTEEQTAGVIALARCFARHINPNVSRVWQDLFRSLPTGKEAQLSSL